jgi:hypothetical protein
MAASGETAARFAAPVRHVPAAQGNRGKPAWVDTPDLVYSKQRYVAAVGFGPVREQAERNALANLTAVFGQSIQAEMKSTASYSGVGKRFGSAGYYHFR